MQSDISKKKLREFGILIFLGFPIFIGFLIPIITGHSFRSWTLIVSIPFGILAFLKPKCLYSPYKAWMKIGLCLGWINSRLILSLVFILVLQPIALVIRLIGYDPLNLKKNTEKSYRKIRSKSVVDLKKIF